MSSTDLFTARFGGAGVAGFCELLVFHPIDTVGKRLMNSSQSGSYQTIIFREAAQKGVLKKWASLFPGFGYGMAYKISQRVYKFGGQKYVRDLLYDIFPSQNGQKSNPWIDASAGALLGAGEIVFLPFDVLKIRAQTNPDFQAQGARQFLREASFKQLYAGWDWTIARNVPGSFALFGAQSVMKNMMGLEDHRKATFLQSALSSAVASCFSVIVSSPMDVIKVRVQSGTFGHLTGFQILKNIFQNEGTAGFFKGLVPKLITIGPKLTFSFTIADYIINRSELKLNAK